MQSFLFSSCIVAGAASAARVLPKSHLNSLSLKEGYEMRETDLARQTALSDANVLLRRVDTMVYTLVYSMVYTMVYTMVLLKIRRISR
jgi:hypothetical protein